MCDVNDGRGGGKATMVEWYPHLPVTILTCNLTLEDFKTPEKTAQCITRQTTSDTTATATCSPEGLLSQMREL